MHARAAELLGLVSGRTSRSTGRCPRRRRRGRTARTRRSRPTRPGRTSSASPTTARPTVPFDVKIKVDKTPPVVTGGAPARGADVNGWYNHAVPITFSGSDQTSGIAACTNTTYGGPDSAAASLSGTCTDNAGNMSSPLPYGLKYDETAPVVAGASPERPPNAAGWFNRPVRFDLARHRRDRWYRRLPGGDLRRRRLRGRVGHGNLPRPSRQLRQPRVRAQVRLDGTANLGLITTVGDRRVALGWTTTADAASLEVARTPGLGIEHTSVVFRGPGDRFLDRNVRNGVRYVYELRSATRPATGAAGPSARSRVPAWSLRRRRRSSRPSPRCCAGHRSRRALLQPAVVPWWAQDPERLAVASALSAEEALDLSRQGSSVRARAVSMARVAGLRPAREGQLRQADRTQDVHA